MKSKTKLILSAQMLALAALASPAYAAPSCDGKQPGDRVCDTGNCYLMGGQVQIDGFTCVQIEGGLQPQYATSFGEEYQQGQWTTLCNQVKDECAEWASSGGGGN